MNLGQIIRRIQIILDDPAILRADIITKVNDKLVAATATVCIPLLDTEKTVTVAADGLTVVMPTEWQHDLLSAFSNTNTRHLTIRTGTKALYEGYDKTDDGEDIKEVAAVGDTLHVRPRAGAEEIINLQFYGIPATLAQDADIPVSIPAHLHEKILVSGPAYEMLPDVTMEAQRKVALASLHNGKESAGLALLDAYFSYAPRATPAVRRKIKWF
ncbi:MAG: hypothetical protein HGJ94_18320 [Desulfosarcina sp.]|nr:hypothetical protein [Desulfosarcina sp.]